MAELRKHAAEQAALFDLGADQAESAEEPTSDPSVGYRSASH
jgi:hypothetical protein